MRYQPVLLLLALAVSAGCRFPPFALQPTDAPAPPTSAPPSVRLPTVPLPTATPLPTQSPSPTPFVPFEAQITADNVNVRANPGRLFAVVMNVKRDTTFVVLGKAPGEEWIYVQAQDETTGWVFARFLQANVDLRAAPLLQPVDVQVVRGQVVDALFQPVSGIQFALTKGSGRTDAMTGDDGVFYAFLPTTASGTWTVSYTAIDCSSNRMDAECRCKDGVCGAVFPPQQTLTLPQSEMLAFVWREIQ